MTQKDLCRQVKTEINAGLTLTEQKNGIRFGTDALLLAAFALPRCRRGLVVDLGTGSGVIPLLMLGAKSKCRFAGIEILPEQAQTAQENARINGFDDRFEVFCGDMQDIKSFIPVGAADYALSNPPYYTMNSGKQSANPQMLAAKHELYCNPRILAGAAAKCLKSGGAFFAVYRPERLASLLFELKNARIEPKRLRAVASSAQKKPSLFLLEAKKDGNEGLNWEKELIIWKDTAHTQPSDEMDGIYKLFA